MNATPTTPTPCGWCEDTTPAHKHFAVLCSEGGKRLGRLTPEGTTTSRNVFASVLSQAKATQVAAEINSGGVFAAKVIPF